MILPNKFIGWVKAGLLGSFVVLLYRDALINLWGKWGREEYSYGYFILPIVLYLIWEKRAELKRVPSVPSWWGSIPVGIGIAFYALGELGGEFTLLFISLWLVLVGLSWLYLGWRKLKVIAFPLCFLLVMFPPPNLIYNNLSLRLQLISSQVGVAMIQIFGMTAYREGNVIDLGFTQLQVVDACSGLRYLFPLLALGILLAYYFRASFWKRVVLVLSTVPVTVFTNSLRIASVGFLFPILGAKAAEGFFHDFSGWLIFMVSLVILLGELWVLNRIFPNAIRPANADHGIDSHLVPSNEAQSIGVFQAILRPPQYVVAAGLLVAMLVIYGNVDFREKVPASKPFNLMPLAVGEWQGTLNSMGPDLIAALNLSDYTLIDYRNPQGREINIYIAYNDSQRKGKSTHSPDSCLPGSGWIFRESGTVAMKALGGVDPSMRVKRAYMEKNGVRQIGYYWFPQRGRILTNMYQLKFYAFWDALTRHRTDGALVRMITPVYEAERTEDAEARLQGFAQQFVPILNEYIPGREVKLSSSSRTYK